MESLLHNAPAVSYPVGRSYFHGACLLLIAMAGLLLGGLWISSVDSLGWRQLLFFGLWLAACTLTGLAWHGTTPGLLSWGGEYWQWHTQRQALGGEVVVHLDVQFCLLLIFRSQHGRLLWLWPERRSAPGRWRALRRAVFSVAGGPSARLRHGAGVRHTEGAP